MSYYSKRKNEILRMNVLLCLLVVFIHVSAEPVSLLQKLSWQYLAVFVPWRLAAFATQGFIFLSGLKLMLSGGSGSFLKYLARRLRRVLVPYLVWNLIYYFYFMSRGYFSFDIQRLSGYVLRGDLVSPFYFVIIIVQFYILFPICRALVRSRVPAAAVLIACAALTLYFNLFMPRIIFQISGRSFAYNDRLFTTYLFFWMAGCYAGAHYGKFCALLKKKKGLICTLWVSLAALDAGLGWLHFTGVQRIPGLEIIHYFYVISAIFFFYLVMLLRTEKRYKLSAAAQNIDRASYSIYLFHVLIINLANEWIAGAGITRISESYMLRAAIVYVSVIVICVIWNKLSSAFRKAV